MDKISARSGWLWIRQGFDLFRKQPGGLATLFLGYMLAMLGVGMLPLLGQILPVMLVPAFSMAFLLACLHIEQGQRVMPNLLLSGFRQPVVRQLGALGALYLLTALLAIGASALVDGGVFWQLITGKIDAKSAAVRNSNIGSAILLTVALYIPAAMGFCFAAPLIYWRKMSVGKAIFFSFFAVLRTLKAFLMFAGGWFCLSLISSQLVMLVFGRSELAMTIMLPLSMMLTIVMHCSFYASYRQIFGAPETDAPEKPAA